METLPCRLADVCSPGTVTGPRSAEAIKDVPFIIDHLRVVEFQWRATAAQGLMKERDALLNKHDLGRAPLAIQMSSHGFFTRTCNRHVSVSHRVYETDKTAVLFLFLFYQRYSFPLIAVGF